jgi:hypothetical protein
MFDQLEAWNNLKGTSTAELLLKLVSDDADLQSRAQNALDYTLLNLGADRDENYGDPDILLKNDVLLHVIPVLAKIVEADTFNWLSKYFGLELLWDVYNFTGVERVVELYPQKTELIRKLVASYMPIYQKSLNHEHEKVQTHAQRLLGLIKAN